MRKRSKIPLLGRFLRWIHTNWGEISDFAYANKTIIELLFLTIYTLEQGFLLFVISKRGVSFDVVSYFALIVLFTFGVHKTIMQSRMRRLDDEIKELKYEKEYIMRHAQEIANSYNDLVEAYNRLERFK